MWGLKGLLHSKTMTWVVVSATGERGTVLSENFFLLGKGRRKEREKNLE